MLGPFWFAPDVLLFDLFFFLPPTQCEKGNAAFAQLAVISWVPKQDARCNFELISFGFAFTSLFFFLIADFPVNSPSNTHRWVKNKYVRSHESRPAVFWKGWRVYLVCAGVACLADGGQSGWKTRTDNSCANPLAPVKKKRKRKSIEAPSKWPFFFFISSFPYLFCAQTISHIDGERSGNKASH